MTSLKAPRPYGLKITKSLPTKDVYKIQDNQYQLKGIVPAKDMDYPSEVDYTNRRCNANAQS